MTNSILLPTKKDSTQFNNWSEFPQNDVQKALDESSFMPQKMHLSLTHNIYSVARFFNMTVPDSTTRGTVEKNGILFNYQWHSMEGRAVDWISLEADFSPNIVQLIAQMKESEGMKNKIIMVTPSDFILKFT